MKLKRIDKIINLCSIISGTRTMKSTPFFPNVKPCKKYAYKIVEKKFYVRNEMKRIHMILLNSANSNEREIF